MRAMMKVTSTTAAFCASVVMVGCVHGEANVATVSVPEAKVASAVKYDKPGFYTTIDQKDGRLWVFKEGSEDLAAYKEKGKPAKHVVRPGAGPGGITLKATESETILEYVATKPGFHVSLDKDGRLWIFEEGSEALANYKEKGKPARHVVRPGAGPFGTTIKAVEFSVLDAYQAAK